MNSTIIVTCGATAGDIRQERQLRKRIFGFPCAVISGSNGPSELLDVSPVLWRPSMSPPDNRAHNFQPWLAIAVLVCPPPCNN
jgi:hypothetical protein